MTMTHTSIQNFYNDRSIFITGATGFVGKVLVEKLLRSCPGIRNIYILVRAKKGKEPRQRLEELFNVRVFDRLKKERPEAMNKVVPINGDLHLPCLGISPADMNILSTNVSIVFHSAATVKFEEPLKESIQLNILGTRRLIELCHKLPHIVAVVHVSTAYSNCNRKDVDETIYPAPVPAQQIIDATEWLDNDIVNSITPKLIGDRPNTYTFTKALAENLLVDECGDLPVAIVRPSIVTAAWKEPFPGWVDNLNGLSGIIAAGGKGILRTMVLHGENVADIIPVDVVISMMISVAWYTAIERPNSIMVYNCTSGSINKITWDEIVNLVYPNLYAYPSAEIFRYPAGTFKRSYLYNHLVIIVQHYLPAVMVDLMAYLFLQKPGMLNLYHKIHKATQCLEFFTTHQWNFHTENRNLLLKEMSEEDKEIFTFDIHPLNWKHFLENHVYGVRKYILKEDPKTIPAARRSLKRRHLKHYYRSPSHLHEVEDKDITKYLTKAFFTREVFNS